VGGNFIGVLFRCFQEILKLRKQQARNSGWPEIPPHGLHLAFQQELASPGRRHTVEDDLKSLLMSAG
jgi:hypothetical protein